MEERPIQAGNPETTPPTLETEKLGKVLLHYELPASDPKPAPEAINKKNDQGVLMVSHEQARIEQINGGQGDGASQEKTPSPELHPPESLPESHFDSRHEVFDDKVMAVRKAEGMVAIGEVLMDTPVNQPHSSVPPVPPPFYPANIMEPANADSSASAPYKKYIKYGLAAGIITGALLIFLLTK